MQQGETSEDISSTAHCNAKPPIIQDEQPDLLAQPALLNDNGAVEFAQTVSQDDLFGDDFTPHEQPVLEHTVSPISPFHNHHSGTSFNNHRGRRSNSFAPRGPGRKPRQYSTNQNPAPNLSDGNDATGVSLPTTTAQDGEAQSSSAPTAPRTDPVRGDRSATGGIAKPKLTEHELAERMAAVKLRNAEVEAAYARAEADKAKDAAREVEAEERRKRERQERRLLMGEREKNRVRKLKAQGGREWDEGKGDAFRGAEEGRDRGSAFRRGVHGGVVARRRSGDANVENGGDNGDAGWATSGFEPRASSRGGRGGRGRGAGRGRGRGGRGGHSIPLDNDPIPPPSGFGEPFESNQKVPTMSDFPSLPSPTADQRNSITSGHSPVQVEPAVQGYGRPKSTGPSWAEEMETSAPA